MAINNTAKLSGYDGATIEKVHRLLEILVEIDRHPFLRTRVCLHGGTALNLFLLDAPRLSVDIDLTYYGAIDKDKTAEERPEIEEALEIIAASLGYAVNRSADEHAGRTFKLYYRDAYGRDQIKIDIIYLNRSPLQLPAHRNCTIETSISFPTLSESELIGGKVKALFGRVTMRDLYDVNRLRFYLGENPNKRTDDESRLLHRVILHQAALSNLFPIEFAGVTARRFAHRESLLASQLYPVLHGDDRPSLTELIEGAEDFVDNYVLPKDDNEQEYLADLANALYRPELLFGEWPDVLEAAKCNPAAQWKIINLAKRSTS